MRQKPLSSKRITCGELSVKFFLSGQQFQSLLSFKGEGVLFVLTSSSFSRKLPPVKRVALFYPDVLNKVSTKIPMFPFATSLKRGVFEENNKKQTLIIKALFLFPLIRAIFVIFYCSKVLSNLASLLSMGF